MLASQESQEGLYWSLERFQPIGLEVDAAEPAISRFSMIRVLIR